jgi:hypothetical protein
MAMNLAQRRQALEDDASSAISAKMIAGALVLQRLEIGGVSFPRGAVLPSEIVEAIAPRNLRALLANHFIEPHNGHVKPPTQPKESSNVRSRSRTSRRKIAKK